MCAKWEVHLIQRIKSTNRKCVLRTVCKRKDQWAGVVSANVSYTHSNRNNVICDFHCNYRYPRKERLLCLGKNDNWRKNKGKAGTGPADGEGFPVGHSLACGEHGQRALLRESYLINRLDVRLLVYCSLSVAKIGVRKNSVHYYSAN